MPAIRLKRNAIDARLVVNGLLSPERRKQAIVDYARAGLKESQEINKRAFGRVPPHDTFVDGRTDERLATVNPDKGVIVFRFQLALEIFEWIEDILIMSSPVGKEPKSPEYSKSHVFFADNVQADPANPPPADVYVFLSTVPYARKIERGQSKQAPDGVYEGVAAMAARRFGNIARVRFGFRSFMEGSLAGATPISELRKQHGRRGASEIAKTENDNRQPAIIIAMN